MARHRQIDIRMWGDEKFRALSPIPPCGQGLWIYLLTGPHTCNIPGLSHVGRAALAEALGWEPEAFDEAFREAFLQGMVEADFRARVIWVPKAICYNQPESPNVVKSWGAYWDEIPECELKARAYQHLKAFLKAKGEAFEKAFLKACGKTRANQEQEQEQDTPPNPPAGGGVEVFPEPGPDPWDVDAVSKLAGEFQADRQAKYPGEKLKPPTRRELKKLAELVEQHGEAEVRKRWEYMLWFEKGPFTRMYSIGWFADEFARWSQTALFERTGDPAYSDASEL